MLFAIRFVMYNAFRFTYTLVLRGDCVKKFKIPAIPATTNKCVRFPNDVIEQVEKELVGTDCTFSAFVIEAVRVALENLREEREQEEK